MTSAIIQYRSSYNTDKPEPINNLMIFSPAQSTTLATEKPVVEAKPVSAEVIKSPIKKEGING